MLGMNNTGNKGTVFSVSPQIHGKHNHSRTLPFIHISLGLSFNVTEQDKMHDIQIIVSFDNVSIYLVEIPKLIIKTIVGDDKSIIRRKRGKIPERSYYKVEDTPSLNKFKLSSVPHHILQTRGVISLELYRSLLNRRDILKRVLTLRNWPSRA